MEKQPEEIIKSRLSYLSLNEFRLQQGYVWSNTEIDFHISTTAIHYYNESQWDELEQKFEAKLNNI